MSIESPGNQRTVGKAEPLLSAFAHDADGLGSDVLSVAVIGPEHQGRKAVTKAVAGFHGGAVREFSSYPELDDLPKLLKSEFEVIIVELDSNPEHALDLVEHICGQASATVMVYSSHTDSEVTGTLHARRRSRVSDRADSAEHDRRGLVRAVSSPAVQRAPQRRPDGKLLVFMGAKGGSGVTHCGRQLCGGACAKLGQQRVCCSISILPLGKRPLTIWDLTAQFSAVDAFRNTDRLDSHFLSRSAQAQLRAFRAGGAG